MVHTKELKESADFYVKYLGFVCDSYSEDWGWCHLKRDFFSLMLATPGAYYSFEQPMFTGTLYFQTDSVDELWAHLKDKVEVSYPIETFRFGMREFAIYDNNGYLLQFGQEIKV